MAPAYYGRYLFAAIGKPLPMMDIESIDTSYTHTPINTQFMMYIALFLGTAQTPHIAHSHTVHLPLAALLI